MKLSIFISISLFIANIIFPGFVSTLNHLHYLIQTKEELNVQNDSIYRENIKTVQIHKDGWELSYPIIELNSEEKIKLSFDILSSELQDYYYTIIHCDADWKMSDLLPSEYLDGFIENQIYNYNFSFNTLLDYIHYSVTIPNEDIQPKISGNYLIIVYENYNREEIILKKRFCIIEPKVSIMAEVKRPSIANYRNNGQEIDFTIDYSSYLINDAFAELKIKIVQNNRWDNSISDLKPLFIRDKKLIFDYNEENVFYGGNEYRFFDIKSLRYQSEFIRLIELRGPNYHIELYPDMPKPFKVYFFENEINGRYFIDIQV